MFFSLAVVVVVVVFVCLFVCLFVVIFFCGGGGASEFRLICLSNWYKATTSASSKL